MSQTKMFILLDEDQKRAVEYKGSPLLIIAGAGTGKTTVITERIKWLIEKQNLNPPEILALTFTEKAAKEMEERVDLALPLGYSQLWISTFHSFCDRILRDEAINIGLDPDFKLLTEAETILFLFDHFYQLNLEYFRPAGNPNKFLAGMLKHFSRLQDEDITPQQYLYFAQNQFKKADTQEEKLEAKKTLELAEAFVQYQKLKAQEGVMDFADLISNTLALFRHRPNLLIQYRQHFKYILVDEFQDTNIAQYELIKLLAPPAKDAPLTVTGDDSQSIYKFRGAAVSNILTFIDDYPAAKIVVLTKNYRSTQTILDYAYRLIKNNDPDTLENRMNISKNLKSQRKIKGREIKLFFGQNIEEEADWVVKEIKKLTQGPKAKYQFKEIAILVRANNHAEPFTRSLARQALPYQFLGPGQLFHQPEIKDLIAYLKVLNDPTDEIALFRVLSIKHFQFSSRDLAFIRSFAKRYSLFLFEALEEIAQENPRKNLKLPFIQLETKNKIKALVLMIHRHLKLIPEQTGGQILYYFLQDSQILKKLLTPKTEDEHQQALNIAKFFDKIKSFENQNREAKVNDLINWINLKMEMGESPLATEVDWSENNAINILTVHSAKGLEFPVVFMVNLVNQRFPTTQRSEQIPIPQPLIKEILPQGDPHEQEERRLFYVGMTRAKDRLYFTGAKFYGEGKLEKKLSPFVRETLGEEKINQIKQQLTINKQQLSFLDWEKPPAKPRPIIVNLPITYLSYSQIDTFKTCQLQYKYRYLLRLPTPPSASMVIGNTIHRTLKQFYQKQATEKEKLSLKTMLKFAQLNWIPEGFTSKKQAEKSKEQVFKMLKKFYREAFEFEKIGRVIALEQPFSLKITPGLTVGGVIDRIDNLEGDKIEIIDYKTGSRIPSQKEVDQDDQLSIYALAISSLKDLLFSRSVDKIILSLYFLDEGIKISSLRTQKQLEATKEKILKIGEEMEKTDFPPKPGRPFPCDFCEFKILCEAWR